MKMTLKSKIIDDIKYIIEYECEKLLQNNEDNDNRKRILFIRDTMKRIKEDLNTIRIYEEVYLK